MAAARPGFLMFDDHPLPLKMIPPGRKIGGGNPQREVTGAGRAVDGQVVFLQGRFGAEDHGSGPNGRIIMKDIELAISAGACSDRGATAQGDEEYSENQLSNVRKLIAKAMCTSLQSTAQLTHHMSADVRKLLMARQKIKSEIASGKACPDITLNDMVCWCVIRALEKFPEANSHLIGETIRTFRNVHLGITVDTTRGLMVPAVRNANKMKLDQLSAELRFEADACRKGNINARTDSKHFSHLHRIEPRQLWRRNIHACNQPAAGSNFGSLHHHLPACGPWRQDFGFSTIYRPFPYL